MVTWTQMYMPMGGLGLSALVALIPIIFFFVALAVLRLKGHVAGAITLILSILIAIFAFKMPIDMAFAAAGYGFIYGLWPIGVEFYSNSVAKGDSSVAIGQGSYSDVDTGIALGSSSVSSRVIAKGSRDTSITENGVVIGYDTTDGELLGALSIGDDGKYRQIINVADGSEAHDAVTVRQLQNAIGAVATTPSKYFHANSTEEDSLAVGEDSLAMGAKTIVNGDAGIGIGLNTLVLTDAINGIAIGSRILL